MNLLKQRILGDILLKQLNFIEIFAFQYIYQQTIGIFSDDLSTFDLISPFFNQTHKYPGRIDFSGILIGENDQFNAYVTALKAENIKFFNENTRGIKGVHYYKLFLAKLKQKRTENTRKLLQNNPEGENIQNSTDCEENNEMSDVMIEHNPIIYCFKPYYKHLTTEKELILLDNDNSTEKMVDDSHNNKDINEIAQRIKNNVDINYDTDLTPSKSPQILEQNDKKKSEKIEKIFTTTITLQQQLQQTVFPFSEYYFIENITTMENNDRKISKNTTKFIISYESDVFISELDQYLTLFYPSENSQTIAEKPQKSRIFTLYHHQISILNVVSQFITHLSLLPDVLRSQILESYNIHYILAEIGVILANLTQSCCGFVEINTSAMKMTLISAQIDENGVKSEKITKVVEITTKPPIFTAHTILVQRVITAFFTFIQPQFIREEFLNENSNDKSSKLGENRDKYEKMFKNVELHAMEPRYALIKYKTALHVSNVLFTIGFYGVISEVMGALCVENVEFYHNPVDFSEYVDIFEKNNGKIGDFWLIDYILTQKDTSLRLVKDKMDSIWAQSRELVENQAKLAPPEPLFGEIRQKYATLSTIMKNHEKYEKILGNTEINEKIDKNRPETDDDDDDVIPMVTPLTQQTDKKAENIKKDDKMALLHVFNTKILQNHGKLVKIGKKYEKIPILTNIDHSSITSYTQNIFLKSIFSNISSKIIKNFPKSSKITDSNTYPYKNTSIYTILTHTSHIKLNTIFSDFFAIIHLFSQVIDTPQFFTDMVPIQPPSSLATSKNSKTTQNRQNMAHTAEISSIIQELAQNEHFSEDIAFLKECRFVLVESLQLLLNDIRGSHQNAEKIDKNDKNIEQLGENAQNCEKYTVEPLFLLQYLTEYYENHQEIKEKDEVSTVFAKIMENPIDTVDLLSISTQICTELIKNAENLENDENNLVNLILSQLPTTILYEITEEQLSMLHYMLEAIRINEISQYSKNIEDTGSKTPNDIKNEKISAHININLRPIWKNTTDFSSLYDYLSTDFKKQRYKGARW